MFERRFQHVDALAFPLEALASGMLRDCVVLCGARRRAVHPRHHATHCTVHFADFVRRDRVTRLDARCWSGVCTAAVGRTGCGRWRWEVGIGPHGALFSGGNGNVGCSHEGLDRYVTHSAPLAFPSVCSGVFWTKGSCGLDAPFILRGWGAGATYSLGPVGRSPRKRKMKPTQLSLSSCRRLRSPHRL